MADDGRLLMYASHETDHPAHSQKIATADGIYFLPTPTIAWSPGRGRDGQLFLVWRPLRNADGSPSAGNGSTIMVSTHGPPALAHASVQPGVSSRVSLRPQRD